MPPIALTRPNKALKPRYERRSLLKFLAAAAGIITSAPISKVPTTLIPKATIKATNKRKIKSIFLVCIPTDSARSSEIVPKINF